MQISSYFCSPLYITSTNCKPLHLVQTWNTRAKKLHREICSPKSQLLLAANPAQSVKHATGRRMAVEICTNVHSATSTSTWAWHVLFVSFCCLFYVLYLWNNVGHFVTHCDFPLQRLKAVHTVWCICVCVQRQMYILLCDFIATKSNMTSFLSIYIGQFLVTPKTTYIIFTKQYDLCRVPTTGAPHLCLLLLSLGIKTTWLRKTLWCVLKELL